MKKGTIFDWKNINNLKIIIASSKSHTETLGKLGLKIQSGNFQTLLKYISLYNIDVSHFEGKKIAYEKLNKANSKRLLSTEEYFINGIHRSSQSSKNRILKEGLKKYECSECNLKPMWNGKKLVLQLDHINGDRQDNRLENLRFLCPNCHSQTETYGKGKIVNFNLFLDAKNIPEKNELILHLKNYGLEKTIQLLKIGRGNLKKICAYYEIDYIEYRKKNQKKEKIVWPENQLLQQYLLDFTLLQLGKKLGVSGNAVKKYAIKNKLFLPTMIHKSYWLKVASGQYDAIVIDNLVLKNGQYQLKPEYVVGNNIK